MKPDKHSFIRILAILLSVFLVMSNPGFSAYAEDFLSASADADEVLAEEGLSSGVEASAPEEETLTENASGVGESAREEEILPGDDDSLMDEKQGEPFSEETSDGEEIQQEEAGPGESISGESSFEELP